MPAWSGVIANLVHVVIGFVIIFDQFGRGMENMNFMKFYCYIFVLDNTMWQLLPPISFNSNAPIPTLGMLYNFFFV